MGSKYAPDALRAHGLDSLLAKHSYTSVQMERAPQKHITVGSYCKSLHDSILAQPKSLEDLLLVLGGDHSLSIGTVNAINKLQPNTGVIWCDAHADINTLETSTSANVHGMSLAFLLGLEKEITQQMDFKWFEPCNLVPRDIVYIGLRDVDPGEWDFINSLGIKYYTVDDVDAHPRQMEGVMEDAMEYLSQKEHLHLSFDIDALDPKIAPHTGTVVANGLTLDEGKHICKTMAKSGKLRSFELVEVNPIIESSKPVNATLDTSMSIIEAVIENMPAKAK